MYESKRGSHIFLEFADPTSSFGTEDRPMYPRVLQAEGDPVGEATVDITLSPEGGGTRVEIREDATRGPGRLVPAPVRQLAIVPRNVEALRRLCLVAEGRAKGH